MGDEGKEGSGGQLPEKPTAAEIFKGKDVVLGKELVELLLAEEVGVPVYYHNYNSLEKKVNVMADREVGEEDFTIRQKEEENNQLLGIVIPSADSKNEFIYLGIHEGDFLFHAGERHHAELNPETSSQHTISWRRFADRIAQSDSYIFSDDKYRLEILFREYEDPQKFIAKVEAAVEVRRKLQSTIRKSREEIRQDLRDRLYGN